MAARMRNVILITKSIPSCTPALSRFICTVNVSRHLVPKQSNTWSRYLRQRQTLYGIAAVRCASTEANSIPAGYVPDIPSAPDVATVHLPTLNKLGEPTFDSLGLGNFSPVGLMQNIMEFVHVSVDIPWWGCLAVMAVGARICLLPLMLKQRKSLTTLTNHGPTINKLQQKIQAAKNTGDLVEMQKRVRQMQNFIKEHNIKYSHMFLTPMVQVPIFASIFIGLRKMCTLPVESLKIGGFGWITDLTVPDPLFILPIVTGVTLLAIIELGTESASTGVMAHHTKWLFRCFPIASAVFVAQYPAAIALYWTVSNILSLIVGQIMKVPRVRKYFNIPDLLPKEQLQKTQKSESFVEGFKNMYEGSKMAASSQDRKRAEEMEFRKAGTGPIPKTYAYDPTKVQKRSESHAV